jgi:hypothetical protein
MGAIANATITLASAVANGGTVTVAYPSGTNQALLRNSPNGRVMVGQDGPYRQGVANNVGITYGASDITITNNTGASWPAGTEIRASFGDTNRNGAYQAAVPTSVPTALTAATGTASDTIADVGGAFTQATLNNNFKSLADKINELRTVIAGMSAT